MAGILYVSSKILEPTKLSVAQFDDWYENEHAPEVLSLAGVPSSIRYAVLPLPPSANTTPTPPHLITYELPDLSYITSPAFKAVGNQQPTPDQVDRIYAHASFDIRFYAEIAPATFTTSTISTSTATTDAATTNAAATTPPARPETEPARFLASVAFSPVSGREGELAVWFAGKFALDLKALDGFVKARRFEFVNGVVMEGGGAAVPGAPKWLALVEFEDAGEHVRSQLKGVLEVDGLVGVEVGWYEVKKVFSEREWGAVGVDGQP